MSDSLNIQTSLRAANIARQAEWDPSDKITLTYRLNELAGETGEACNVGKKIERERLGIRGSRDTIEHLAEELADVVICADLVAMAEGIDLDAAVVAKFNATSEKVGLKTRIIPKYAQPVALPTDEGGCVTKRFVIFTTPGWAPEKKGGWLKDEHLIDFLRSVMLHDDWKPGFRATVLELTWDNDLWASSATEYLSMHDEAIGPRRARKAWQEARAEHERIYKAAPKMKLGDEIDSFIKATAITHPAPDALREEVERLRAALNTPEVDDFAKAVVLEAQHQRERWPSEHDAGKAPLDWFWLVGYLAQKAATAQMARDDYKAKHHTISTAAALANWHAAISGEHTAMRPGIEPPATEALATLQAEQKGGAA